MDRKLRRQLIRHFEKTGLTNAQAKRLLEIHEAPDLKGSLKEGNRVKLNLKSIQNHPDYPTMNPRRKKFIEDNKDGVFTVKYHPNHQNEPNLVSFKEDDLWLWYVGDLEKVKND